MVDYRGKNTEQLASAIKETISVLQGKIVGTYETVNTQHSRELLAEVLQPDGGVITTVARVDEAMQSKNVKYIYTYVRVP